MQNASGPSKTTRDEVDAEYSGLLLGKLRAQSWYESNATCEVTYRSICGRLGLGLTSAGEAREEWWKERMAEAGGWDLDNDVPTQDSAGHPTGKPKEGR